MAGRVLAIDLGDVHVGLALSDATGKIALPYGVLRREKLSLDLQRLADTVRKAGADRIVVGLPLNLDGSGGRQARRALDFADRLRAEWGLPVDTWDERLTTREAERRLIEGDVSRSRRRGLIDQTAACLLLQAYLDHRNRAVPAKLDLPTRGRIRWGHCETIGVGAVPEGPEEMEGIIVLTDEDGEEHEFELVDMLELEGKRYAILMPAGEAEDVLDDGDDEDDDDEDEDGTVVLRVETDPDGNDILVQIEDDDEWERVVQAWEEILDEEAVLPEDEEDN
ncbi:MAG TPA: Holliday junction resolvase RuvX [Bacillota bacterium]|nr:Holliday junction resolvase RuvX [Bacillota bacterium]